MTRPTSEVEHTQTSEYVALLQCHCKVMPQSSRCEQKNKEEEEEEKEQQQQHQIEQRQQQQ